MLSPRRVIFLSSLGGAFEMYDFVVYMALTPYLAPLFFPADDPFVAMISTFAVFAIGYLIRPFGGIIFGHLGDRLGRKKMFVASILLMSIPAFFMGLLPTHETIGRLAPILLIVLRMLQGIAVGGEIPGAMTFTCEYIDPKKRGFAGGTIFCGLNYGIAFASLVIVLLTSAFNQTQMLDFGWRIPFIFGGLLGLVAVYLRTQASESPLYLALQEKNELAKLPIKTLLQKHFRSVVAGTLITATGSSLIILGFTYVKEFMVMDAHYGVAFAGWLVFAATLISATLQIFFGSLSDHWGRVRLLIFGIILLIIFAAPIFSLLSQADHTMNILGMMILAVIAAIIIGIYPTFLIELFPTQVRYSGYGISYNIAFAIFGGLSPMVATTLIHNTGNLLMPGFLLIGTGVIGLLGALLVHVHKFHHHH